MLSLFNEIAPSTSDVSKHNSPENPGCSSSERARKAGKRYHDTYKETNKRIRAERINQAKQDADTARFEHMNGC